MKQLIVVLMIGAGIFRLAKPSALIFSEEQDFARRRNVWFLLTITGFLSPSFWIFALVTVVVLLRAGRKDSNPLALYMVLLHVITPIRVNIPVVGINTLFDLDMYRLLSLFLLLPVTLRIRKSKTDGGTANTKLMDVLVVLYGLLQTLVFIYPDLANAASLHNSVTDELRRGFLFFIDAYLVYYVFSRACDSRRAIAEVLAAFCLASAIMSTLAIFEYLRHWLLYESVGSSWGGEIMGQYLERNGMVRATVSSGHSLALGYLCAISLGLWLYLQTHVVSPWARRGLTVLFVAGLLAAYSRGPWGGAIVIYFAFAVLVPRALTHLFKASASAMLLGSLLFLSPLGERITQVIPFLGGKVDEGNVDYRRRLARRSWDIISSNPWFGDSNAYSKLHDMRQGVGVIDFVNAYAEVAVFYGLVGVFLFVSFMLIAFVKTSQAAKALRVFDSDLATLGAALAACILGTFLMIYSSSFVFAYQKLYYVLAGLAAAYIRVSDARLRHPPSGATSIGRGRHSMKPSAVRTPH